MKTLQFILIVFLLSTFFFAASQVSNLVHTWPDPPACDFCRISMDEIGFITAHKCVGIEVFLASQ